MKNPLVRGIGVVVALLSGILFFWTNIISRLGAAKQSTTQLFGMAKPVIPTIPTLAAQGKADPASQKIETASSQYDLQTDDSFLLKDRVTQVIEVLKKNSSFTEESSI